MDKVSLKDYNMNIRNSIPKVSYYLPEYVHLQEIVEYFKDYEILNFHIDFKNTLCWNHNELSIYEPIELAKIIVLQTFEMISYIKSYMKRIAPDLKLRILFFTEEGKSLHHKKIIPEYKSNRNSDFPDEGKDRYLRGISISVKILEKILNYIPNIYFFRGDNLEYDCIPYFFMKYLVNHEKESNVLFSRDRDHNQITTTYSNFIQLDKGSYNVFGDGKSKKTTLLLTENNIINRFLKLNADDTMNIFMKEYFSLYRAIVGDGGDGIVGLKGIGGKKANIILPKLWTEGKIKPMNEIRKYCYSLDLDNFEKSFKKNPFSVWVDTDFTVSKSIDKKTGKDKSKTYDMLTNDESQIRIIRNIIGMDYETIVHFNKYKIKDYIQPILKQDKITNINSYVSILFEMKCMERQYADMIDWLSIFS